MWFVCSCGVLVVCVSVLSVYHACACGKDIGVGIIRQDILVVCLSRIMLDGDSWWHACLIVGGKILVVIWCGMCGCERDSELLRVCIQDVSVCAGRFEYTHTVFFSVLHPTHTNTHHHHHHNHTHPHTL